MLRIVVLFTVIFSFCAFGRGQSYAQVNQSQRYLNIGIGASNWGVPFFASLDLPLSKDYQFMNLGFSYQSQKEVIDYTWLYGQKYTWKHSITGIHTSWNMSLDEYLEDMLAEELQLYVGLQLDYYIWRTKLIEENLVGQNVTYSGTGSGGVGLGGRVGARYFFGKGKRLALHAVLGGGTRSSNIQIGLSKKL